MENDYRFLTDHSYSMIDYDTLSLKQRTMKNKKHNKISNRSNQTTSTNRTVSIDRNSSDKENNLSNSTNVSIPIINISKKNKTKSSIKKKTSRIQSKKKQNNKNNIIKKKNPIISHSIDTIPSLSIEECVKLRRTRSFQIPIQSLLNKKSSSNIKKQKNLSKTNQNIIKSKKFFLGSGLDLDNILLGNRQRRSIKT